MCLTFGFETFATSELGQKNWELFSTKLPRQIDKLKFVYSAWLCRVFWRLSQRLKAWVKNRPKIWKQQRWSRSHPPTNLSILDKQRSEDSSQWASKQVNPLRRRIGEETTKWTAKPQSVHTKPQIDKIRNRSRVGHSDQELDSLFLIDKPKRRCWPGHDL